MDLIEVCLAGLVAARESHPAGVSVTVLEAADRLGGRVHSRAHHPLSEHLDAWGACEALQRLQEGGTPLPSCADALREGLSGDDVPGYGWDPRRVVPTTDRLGHVARTSTSPVGHW